MHVIYVVSGIDSAFSSQVIALLNELAKCEELTNIDLCIGLRKGAFLPAFEIESKIQVYTFRRFPDYPFLIDLTAKNLSKLLQTLSINDETIIHTRNELSGWLAQKALFMFNKQAKLLVDVRGTVREELEDFFSGSMFAKKLKLYMMRQVREVYHQSSAINTVSETLKQYLINEFSVNESKIFTIPCSANNTFVYDIHQREAIRSQYGLNESDTVVVFASGGANLWQNTDETVLTLARIGVKVFNLSKHKINHPNVISTFVPYNEMPKYLSAADVGIVFREHHIVNKVASPIKFAEYIACGLPVVANDSVEQIVDVIQTYKVGQIVSGFKEIDKELFEKLKIIDRREIEKIGRQIYSIQNIAEAYIAEYQKLLGHSK